MGHVIIGMDPHKRSATIEVIDGQEKILAQGRFGTGRDGYKAMQAAGRGFPDRTWAIEGCGGIGRHIARWLVADGEAMLLGRRSYEFLAARWPSRTGELADRLNSKPKYVVSSTLQDPAWNNTNVLKGDVVNEVSTLKRQLAADIVVAGSFQLVHTLLEHDLVDELRLMVYPVVLGTGRRLFGETSDKKSVRLVGNKTVAGDLAYLTYELVRDA